ncbi:MAG: glycosyltransferase [Caldisericaceae bacterium]
MNGVFIFIVYQFFNTLLNAIIVKKPIKRSCFQEIRVSVLVPARNEEGTIEKCINSLLSQDYENIEIVVLDDNSSDRTSEIIKSIKDRRLIMIDGKEEPPEGWTGKNWACYRLYLHSTGDILIFADADTYFAGNAVSIMVDEMQSKNLDFITGIPREDTISFGEKVTVPFLNFSILSMFPIFLSFLSRYFYFFMFANGQFMMFKRKSYEKIQGHKGVKGAIVEDIELSKVARKSNLRVGIFNLSELVGCRMYKSFREAFIGLSKSYFPLFELRLIPSLFVWIWMLVISFAPIFALVFRNPPIVKFLAAASIFETLLIWLIASIKFKLPRELPLYYPLVSLVNSIIGFASVFLVITGKSTWKGRAIRRKNIRLF